MSIPTLTVTPSTAVGAYGLVQSGGLDASNSGADFGAALTRAVQGVVDAGHTADSQSMKALAGQGNVTDLAAAVTRAELALQTAISIRDRVVQAFQDVSRMSI